MTNTNTFGPGSLSQAITDLNATGSTTGAPANTIVFQIPGSGPHTIPVNVPFPDIMKPVLIDAWSQGGAGYTGPPLIEIDGSRTDGVFAIGLHFTAGNSTLQGINIHGFGTDQILLDTAGGDLVRGNYIGTDISGQKAGANRVPGLGNGLAITGISNNTIGGTTAAARNVISGDPQDQVDVSGAGATANVIIGNYIGTNASGTSAVPNGSTKGTGDGVAIFGGASGNSIGGSAPGSGNLISGNVQNGIGISGAGTRGNSVLGNLIGTNAGGRDSIPNAVVVRASGISILGGASENTIGGVASGAGNLVSGNANGALNIVGVGTTGNVVLGNLIGTDISGTDALPNGTANNYSAVAIQGGASANTIGGAAAGSRNVISGNAGTGLNVAGAGTTANAVLGNFIGTDRSGTHELGNGQKGAFGDGIDLFEAATGNTIGGTTPGAGNVISGNHANGIGISQSRTSGNIVVGNLIGTSANGSSALPNVIGVVVYAGASGNTIGGAAPGARNVISGNSADGIGITGSATTGNQVLGNLIGTGIKGSGALANRIGIALYGGATTNSIGGTSAGDRNIISGNAQSGISIIGPGTLGNLIRGNYVGVGINGNERLGNGNASHGPGLTIYSGASENTIGGTAQGAGNVISGNYADGVRIYGAGTSGNRVLGNLIGTSFDGNNAIPNGSRSAPADGVAIYAGATANSVGGTTKGAGNVLSGNSRDGVSISESGTSGNVILGNLIGTNVAASAALHNLIGVAVFAGASGNTIGGASTAARNIISGNTQQGVVIIGSATAANIVRGNFIGTNSAGSAAIPNGDGGNFAGVGIFGGAVRNTIGGTASGAGNVVSGNVGDGIEIANAGTVGNIVRGNFIGTNASGTATLPNGSGGAFGFGVDIYDSASANTIGGTVPGAGNVISGNRAAGVRLVGTGTSQNVIQQNFIGTDPSGVVDLGNDQEGIVVESASLNRIGGTAVGAGNAIAFNGGPAVHVLSGDRISILGNSIYANHGPGIKLDGNANDRARPPVLSFRARGSSAGTIVGRVVGAPGTPFLIELFSNPPTGGAFPAQGKVLLGSVSATAGSDRVATFTFSLSAALPPGTLVTATATDSAGNTSPFSAPVAVTALPGAGAAVRMRARWR